jgi:hypothetical protein
MCVVAVKYIDKYGWVGAKNRDRNYKVDLSITKRKKNGVQRLYIDDNLTRWTEGINEYGVCIISAALSVKNDEKEAAEKLALRAAGAERPSSPTGLVIRNALVHKEPRAALQSLIDGKLVGCSFIFNETDCYLLEGGYVKDESGEEDEEYVYTYKKIPREVGHAVRTNHGVYISNLGYSKVSDHQETVRNRISSESRYKIVDDIISKDSEVLTPADLLDACSASPEKDPFLNPVRSGDPTKGDMVTTGQLLLVPKERTLHYRPIHSAVNFDYSSINGKEDAKVFFEIVSSRRLLTFKKYVSANKK